MSPGRDDRKNIRDESRKAALGRGAGVESDDPNREIIGNEIRGCATTLLPVARTGHDLDVLEFRATQVSRI